MSIKIDLENIVQGPNNATNFTTQLLRLTFKADVRNKELLRKGFPNIVKTVEAYRECGEILDLEQD